MTSGPRHSVPTGGARSSCRALLDSADAVRRESRRVAMPHLRQRLSDRERRALPFLRARHLQALLGRPTGVSIDTADPAAMQGVRGQRGEDAAPLVNACAHRAARVSPLLVQTRFSATSNAPGPIPLGTPSSNWRAAFAWCAQHPKTRSAAPQRATTVVPRCRSSISAVVTASVNSVSGAPCRRSSAIAFLVVDGPCWSR